MMLLFAVAGVAATPEVAATAPAEITPTSIAMPDDTMTAEPQLIPEPTPHIEELDENTISRSYEFIAQARPFEYKESPKTFVLDGRTYSLVPDSAEYFVKDQAPHFDIESKDFTETLEKRNVGAQNDDIFDETIWIERDGFTGEIPRIAVDYSTATEQGASRTATTRIAYGEQPETPTAPETIDKGGQRYTFDRWETNGDRWETNFYADLRLESNTPTCKLESGKTIDLEADSPQWKSIELSLMNEMRLDPGAHIISSAKWLNSLQADENSYSRKIRFIMQRHVVDYTAVYTAEIPGDSHEVLNAKAVYRGMLEKETENGIDYTVVCKMTYTAPPEVTPAPTPTPELTPTPEPSMEALAEPEEKKSNPLLGFVMLVLVAGGLGVAAFVGKNWWDKRNAEEE